MFHIATLYVEVYSERSTTGHELELAAGELATVETVEGMMVGTKLVYVVVHVDDDNDAQFWRTSVSTKTPPTGVANDVRGTDVVDKFFDATALIVGDATDTVALKMVKTMSSLEVKPALLTYLL